MTSPRQVLIGLPTKRYDKQTEKTVKAVYNQLMRDYPDYVHRLLAQAKQLLQDDAYAHLEIASLCFDVLTYHPDNAEAEAILQQAFRDPVLIHDQRRAIGRHIDEWDDRAWQQRRRYALSFRFLSEWGGEEAVLDPQIYPEEAQKLLVEGRDQLLQDYLIGQPMGREMAWPLFQEAIARSADPAQAMLWVGFIYADHGYFAESVDMLESLMRHYPKEEAARRLHVEARWWRDNHTTLGWIPPNDGSGQRYLKVAQRTDPKIAQQTVNEPMMDYMPPDPENLPADFELPLPLTESLSQALANLLGETSLPKNEVVDWSFLQQIEDDTIDVSQFPSWVQYVLKDIEDPHHEQVLKHLFLSHFSNVLPNDEESE